MEERDYQTYIELFHNMANFMRKPNLIVHLDVTPEESLERIKKRSRDCECSIPIEYLRKLHVAYEEFIDEISKVIPVIKVNWNTFRSTEEMANVIEKGLYSIRCA
jgi:deoxyadenosine/deoxycytidine kinase